MIQTRETIHRSCPHCRQDNRRGKPHKISSSGWEVKECVVCRFVYLENAPPYESLEEEHAWEKSSKLEELRRQKENGFRQSVSKATRRRLKLPRKHVLDFLKRFAPDGRVLDIGCGNAGYMQQLAPRHQPCGIEISKELAAIGRENLAAQGGMVLNASALEGMRQLSASDFAAVVMRAYLEHEIRPMEVLLESFRILKKSGILVIKVPNFGSLNAAVMGKGWCGVRLPDHVNYFTPPLLSTMVQKAGFQIYRFGWLSYRQPTSDNMWLIAQKQA